MKRISIITVLALLSFVSIAKANDNPLDIPANVKSDLPSGQSNNSDSANLYGKSDLPASTNMDDYVNYFNAKFEAGRKNYMSSLAWHAPLNANTHCLWHKDAFGFKSISDTQTEVTCFAGSSHGITHILKYEIVYAYNPADCASSDKVKAFFGPTATRNAQGVQSYLNYVASTCNLTVQYVDRLQPVVESYPLTADYVNAKLSLPDYQDLKNFVGSSSNSTAVNSNRSGKGSSGFFSDDFSNPAAGAATQHSAPAK